jgi:chromosome segregation ATPase
MDRIGAGVENLTQGGGDPGLAEALEEERLANAQLQERLRSLHDKHDAETAELKARIEELEGLETVREEMQKQSAALARFDTDLQRLRQANEQLRASNAALREANEAGVGEPHLINKAMLAELEALRASRAADVSETQAILSRLTPLIEQAGLDFEEEGA